MRKFILGIAAALMVVAPASAATVLRGVAFTGDSSGPIPVLSGSFTYSYDDLIGPATTLQLRSIDFAINSTIFDLSNTVIEYSGRVDQINGAKFALLGGVQVRTGENNFVFSKRSPNANSVFIYRTSDNRLGGTSTFSSANTLTFTDTLIDTPVASAVPEPATWAMFLLGFVGIGAGMRMRTTKRKQLSFS